MRISMRLFAGWMMQGQYTRPRTRKLREISILDLGRLLDDVRQREADHADQHMQINTLEGIGTDLGRVGGGGALDAQDLPSSSIFPRPARTTRTGGP